jgi:Na+/H+-dicarboxylate symporter
MLSSVVGASIYHFDLHFSNPFGAQNLEPYWNFVLPKIIENDKAMFLGIGFGLVLPFMNRSLSEKIAVKLDSIVHILLKCILYIMPFFILGFIIKLKHDGIIQNMIKEYSLIFMMIAASLIMYITFLYALSARFNFSKTLQRINHMLPATMVGFSTMSSAMAMPLTILASETNAKEGGLNADMTRTVVPLTVNIHLIGDCFAIPIFAYAILKNYGMAEPEFVSYLIFAFYFVLAKFSVAAIPGGGILVMLPILEAHLGFTAPMLSLITALYILFDPIITCANVLGNGAFALLVSRKIKVRTKSLPL